MTAAPPEHVAVLRFRLTTRTALGRPVARLIVRALARRLPSYSFDADGIETAVHEAVVNAALHGNLGVGQPDSLGSDSIAAFAALVEERLASADLGHKPILILAHRCGDNLEVTVRDAGAGFAPRPAGPASAASSGRGLRLIRAHADLVTHHLDGREIRLSFRLRHADKPR